MSKKSNKVIEMNKNGESTETKIDAIKNLIFGENIQAYDSEFESLKKDILSKKKVLEKLIEEVRENLNTAIDNVSTDVNIRITELEDSLEHKISEMDANTVSKENLGKLLIDLGEKVSQK